jgi:nucleoside-diphosphate-sugar epimerase
MTTFSGRHIVIFGCGYVGAAVARWAASAGLRVTALTRNTASAVVLREVGITTVVADLAGHAWHDEISPAPEFAINCVSSGGGGTEGYRHSYLEGTESIVAWATRRGSIGTFLYTSSTAVYPQGEGAVVDESGAVAATSDRVQVLLDTEARVQSATGKAWQRWFILRLAGIYGPGRHHLLEQVRAGEVTGAGEHHLNLIHRDDIVTAVAACAGAPPAVANEIFNLADDGGAGKSEIVGWLARELGVPAPRFTGVAYPGRRTVTPDRVIANDKLKSMLGWSPRYSTFREGYANLLSH